MHIRAFTLFLALAATIPRPVQADVPPGVMPATSPARGRSFSVRVSGHGRPMILIAGLACSGDVWDDFVQHYADRYRMHVVTLEGFGGERVVAGASLDTVQRDLARYIRDAQLGSPILVGHSLGATVALALAEADPDLVGAVIAVDGVPYLPALFNPAATPGSMAVTARALTERMAALPPAAYRAESRAAVATMVVSPLSVDRIASWGARSDQRTVGNAMAYLLTHDFRSAEARIRAPVLMVAAAKDATTPEALAAVSATYEAQIARIARHRVVLAEGARHFVMIDDPDFLYSAIDSFTGSLHDVRVPSASATR